MPRSSTRVYPWLVVALLAVVGCLNYLDRMMITTMRGSILADIPMTEAQFGLLTSVFLWVYGLLSPLAGFLADRFPRSRVIVGSLLVWSAVTWLTARASTFEELLLTRALMGLSEACYIPAALALIVDYHRGATRSLAVGVHMSGMMVGQSLGFVGGWLAERQSWNYAFGAFGLVGIGYALLLAGLLRDPAQPESTAGAGASATAHVRFGDALRGLLVQPAYRLAIAVWGLAGVVSWLVAGWLPTYFRERFGLSQTVAGLYATGYVYAASLLGVLAGGFLADRWSRTNPRGRILMPVVGLLLAAPGLFVAGGTDLLPLALGGFLLYAFTRPFLDANLMPILCLFADPRYRATGYGVLNLVSCLVGGAGLYAGGLLRDAAVDLNRLFQLAAGLLLVCAGLLYAVRPHRTRRENPADLEREPAPENPSPRTTMPKRIALLGIYHETNTFIETPTTLDDFRNGYWLEGEAIRREYAGAHHEISGVIEVIDACPDFQLVPVLYVSATPGGLIARETYEAILAAMGQALDAVLPVDGCVVVPHGAGVAGGYPDLDGHWLGWLREQLGPSVPITGTLDPHANLSPAMVAATDALVAYATNPHVDQRATGRKVAELLVGILRGQIRPVQHLVQLPLAISIEQQHTAAEPCRSWYADVEDLRQRHGLLSTSVLLGFPYADVTDMGSSVVLIPDERRPPALPLAALGQHLTELVMGRKELFNGEKTPIERVLPRLGTLPGPVLLLDMGDNVGGGAPGNSTHLLAALEGAGVAPVFVCLHDPAAVREAARHHPGDWFSLRVGSPKTPYPTEVQLLRCLDGKFSESTPKHGGYVHYDMGETALVQTEAGNTVMLTTHRTPPYSLRQLTAFGLRPEAFAVIVAKGVNAPLAAYGPVCPSVVQVDTPGVTGADMTRFAYRHRRRPLFPFETDEF